MHSYMDHQATTKSQWGNNFRDLVHQSYIYYESDTTSGWYSSSELTSGLSMATIFAVTVGRYVGQPVHRPQLIPAEHLKFQFLSFDLDKDRLTTSTLGRQRVEHRVRDWYRGMCGVSRPGVKPSLGINPIELGLLMALVIFPEVSMFKQSLRFSAPFGDRIYFLGFQIGYTSYITANVPVLPPPSGPAALHVPDMYFVSGAECSIGPIVFTMKVKCRQGRYSCGMWNGKAQILNPVNGFSDVVETLRDSVGGSRLYYEVVNHESIK
ncbi:hypothetical protein B0H14DRAFT_2560600 [Mycena olivaceomarginata]|nr:hypothetical protein B0H14DRAFT_2560600 [Mycena olivaceomarginata]